jgi:CRP-like cAMP-binding protein
MKNIADELSEHPFFEDLDPDTIQFIAGCGMNAVYRPDELLAREGDSADQFFVVRKGRVALEMHSTERGVLQVETLDTGDVLGWSFLVPPYRWPVTARAVQVVHTIRMDGRCIRDKCSEDPRLGYDLMTRFAVLIARRLDATRIQLLDLYGQLDL